MNRVTRKEQRQARTRKRIRNMSASPRLSVFRSNKGFAAQIISDKDAKTLLGLIDKKIEAKVTKTEKARMLGMEIAKMAKEKKITSVVFDKGSYAYHGRVKAFAEGAREGGLKF